MIKDPTRIDAGDLLPPSLLAELDFLRYPVLRRGEREPIPRLVRRMIWWRDEGRCQRCGTNRGPMELDHIIPWSANGSDDSSNLRVLCAECNQTRSNFHLGDEHPMTPVVLCCDPCLVHYQPLQLRPVPIPPALHDMRGRLDRRSAPRCLLRLLQEVQLRPRSREAPVIESLTQHTDLPSGQHAAVTVADRGHIAVRIEDRVCVAHRPWMTLAEARAVAADLFELAGER